MYVHVQTIYVYVHVNAEYKIGPGAKGWDDANVNAFGAFRGQVVGCVCMHYVYMYVYMYVYKIRPEAKGMEGWQGATDANAFGALRGQNVGYRLCVYVHVKAEYKG